MERIIFCTNIKRGTSSMNTTTKYSINTYQDYAYVYYSGNVALNEDSNSDNDTPQEVVAKAEDYNNTNLLNLPADFKLRGFS